MKATRMGLQRSHASQTDSLAYRIMQSGLTIAEMRAASPLEENAQRIVDKAVVEVGLERLAFAKAILDKGLTFPLTDAMSIMEVQHEVISKTGGAQRTMDPGARGENQRPDRKIYRTPVYLTTDDFFMGIRLLKASERVGTPLDTTLVKSSTRRVNEGIEDASINGGGPVVGGNDATVSQSHGLLDAPNANTSALTTDWTAVGTVGTDGPARVADLLAIASVLQGDFKFGPYDLVLGTKASNAIQADFKANTTDTIEQRIKRLTFIGDIITADRFPGASTGNQLAMVQMTDDVVDMVTGQSPTVVPWTSNDGYTLFWLVLAIQIPRFKTDYDGNSGVCLGTKS